MRPQQPKHASLPWNGLLGVRFKFLRGIAVLSVIGSSIFAAPTPAYAADCVEGSNMKTVSEGDYTYVAIKHTGSLKTSTTEVNTTCTWQVPVRVTQLDVLVVGGGGGGGFRYGGGGGGGDVLDYSLTVSPQSTVTVVVGAGGEGGNVNYGESGAKSAVSGVGSTLTAAGGGGGAQGNTSVSSGGAGGSGGGGSVGTAANSYPMGYGGAISNSTDPKAKAFSGGRGYYASASDNFYGGGGGGAGGIGQGAVYNSFQSQYEHASSAGGAGVSAIWLSSSAAQALGIVSANVNDAGYFGAGGGGGNTTSTSYPGGIGGGGSGGAKPSVVGGPASTPGNGANHTGSGGGGGAPTNYAKSTYWSQTASSLGGNGGSGVVVIRYLAKTAQTISGTVNPGTKIKGQAPIAVSAIAGTASSGLPVTYSTSTPSVCALTSGQLSFPGSGTCTIKVDQAGDTTYAAAPTVAVSFSVSAYGTASVLVLSSKPTTATAGESFNPQPSIQIQDDYSNVVGNSSLAVTVTIISGPGTFSTGSSTSSKTATNGIATFSGLRIDKAGNYTLTYSAAGLPTVQQDLTVRPGSNTKVVLTQAAEATLAGVTFSTPPIVEIRDAFDNLNTGSIALVKIEGAPFASGSTTVNASGGIATFDGLRIDAAGTYTLTFKVGVLPIETQTITILPSSANKLQVKTSAANATAGSAFNAQPVVKVVDTYANLIVDSSAPVTVSVVGGSFDGGTTIVNAVNGEAAFSGLRIDTAGTYTLEFTSSGLVLDTQTLTVAPAAAHKVVVKSSASGAVVGSPFTGQPVISVQDQFGNRITNSTASISVALDSGSFASGSTTSVTAVSGEATFTNLQLNSAGTHTLTFSSGTLLVATQQLTVDPAPPTKIVLTQSASGATAGATFTVQPAIALQDQFNAVTNSSLSVTVAITAGPSGGAFGTGAVVTVSAINGQVSFDGLRIDTAGNYTLEFTSSGLTKATQTLEVAAAAANKLHVSRAASGATAGSALIQQPQVQVHDAFGNVISSSSAQVTVTITSGPGTFFGGLETATATAISGTVTFSSLRLDTAGTYSLKYESSGLTMAAQNLTVSSTPTTITISAGDNQSVEVFAVVGTAPKVRVTDAYGNPSSGQSVTFAVASGGGTLASAAAVLTDNDGYASAPEWTLGNALGAQTLTATWNTTSVTFTVTAKTGQTITIGAVTSKTVGDADFVLTANASSNLSVTFTSTSPTICTITNAMVKIIAAGECIIVAEQGGDATFAPAPTVTTRFSVVARVPSGGGSSRPMSPAEPQKPKDPDARVPDPNWPGVTVDPVKPPKDPKDPGKPGITEFDLSGLPKDVKLTPPTTEKLPKGVTEVVIKDGKVTVKAGEKFTGQVMVEIMVVENGQTKPLLVPVMIDPLPVASARAVPTTSKKSKITWTPVVNAVKYELAVNGKVVCSSTATTCAVPALLGPKARVELTTLGNDGTKSMSVAPAYVPGKPVPALAVNFGRSQTALTAAAKKQLDAFVMLMKEQGFTEVTMQAFTDLPTTTSRARALTSSRNKAVTAYLSKFLEVKLVAAPAKRSATGRAADRRVELAVR